MTEAYLVGAGQSDYGSFPDESYRSLFATAFADALDSVPRGMSTDDIDEAVVGTLGVGGVASTADIDAAMELGERFRPPQVLRRKVRAGKLGRKTGEGFYVWEDGEAVRPAGE